MSFHAKKLTYRLLESERYVSDKRKRDASILQESMMSTELASHLDNISCPQMRCIYLQPPVLWESMVRNDD